MVSAKTQGSKLRQANRHMHPVLTVSAVRVCGVRCVRGEKCEGCTEKGDFLRLVKKVLPKQIELQQAAKAAKAAKAPAAAAAKGADKKDL